MIFSSIAILNFACRAMLKQKHNSEILHAFQITVWNGIKKWINTKRRKCKCFGIWVYRQVSPSLTCGEVLKYASSRPYNQVYGRLQRCSQQSDMNNEKYYLIGSNPLYRVYWPFLGLPAAASCAKPWCIHFGWWWW